MYRTVLTLHKHFSDAGCEAKIAINRHESAVHSSICERRDVLPGCHALHTGGTGKRRKGNGR